MSRGKILIVDDEADIRELALAYLQKAGYETFEAQDGLAALKTARAFRPDIIVLDILLPGMDGLQVLSTLRRESEVYVILLTAKTEEVDKIVGLNLGADDYMTKPFSPRELVARVNATMRRLGTPPPADKGQVFQFSKIRLDEKARQVWVDDRPLELTAIEFDLLYTLMAHHNQVLSRQQLLEHVWGNDYYGETRVVDVHIGHIRKKLGGRFIDTVWGIGYRFRDERLM